MIVIFRVDANAFQNYSYKSDWLLNRFIIMNYLRRKDDITHQPISALTRFTKSADV